MAKEKAKELPTAVACGSYGGKALVAASGIISAAGPAIEAVEKGINLLEGDPEISYTGVGARPNAAGVVECEAAIMAGAGHRGGAVANLKEIERPISVARAVMEKNPHTMLCDGAALSFALRRGFKRKRLLTGERRGEWLKWYKTKRRSGDQVEEAAVMLALDGEGDLAAGYSTGGLPFRPGGCVGLGPIIGGGIYVDNSVGAAAAYGNADLMMLCAPSFLVVELIMDGMKPQDACETVLERIRELRPEAEGCRAGLVALDRKGRFGAAALHDRFSFAVWRQGDKEAEVFTIRQI